MMSCLRFFLAGALLVFLIVWLCLLVWSAFKTDLSLWVFGCSFGRLVLLGFVWILVLSTMALTGLLVNCVVVPQDLICPTVALFGP